MFAFLLVRPKQQEGERCPEKAERRPFAIENLSAFAIFTTDFEPSNLPPLSLSVQFSYGKFDEQICGLSPFLSVTSLNIQLAQQD